MRAVVVYESLYGNTHAVAEAIGDGLRTEYDTTVVAVDDATPQVVAEADLVVVGGPTHVHGMTRPTTRKAAVDDAAKRPDELPPLDPQAQGAGLREWFDGVLPGGRRSAAAFDTRIDAPALLTGAASHAIARHLRHLGFHVVDEPTSFLVDKHTHLLDGEADRARTWAEGLCRSRQHAS